MADEDYVNLANEIIADRKAKDEAEYQAAIARAQSKQDAIDRDAKLIAESEKEYAKIHKEQLRQVLFYGLDSQTAKYLEELLKLSNKLIYVDNTYDPDHKRRISICAQMDVLRNKITNAGRNLGDITFVKKTYYQSINKDYFIFPDQQGVYHLFAGSLGAFRTTDRSLEVDDKGQPLKIFKQDRIQTSPEIPICDYETVVIKDPKDIPKPVATTRPRKPLFLPNSC